MTLFYYYISSYNHSSLFLRYPTYKYSPCAPDIFLKLGGVYRILNTDQDSQFTSKTWIDTLKSHHISMDNRGHYLDNIFVERLWCSVKQECLYLHEFASISELKKAPTKYFDYYNQRRNSTMRSFLEVKPPKAMDYI